MIQEILLSRCNAGAQLLEISLRRECLDHIVVVGEQHLRHILACYMDYYNAVRTARPKLGNPKKDCHR